jgi:hypothetical protein
MYDAPEAVVGTSKFRQGKSGILFRLDYLVVFFSFYGVHVIAACWAFPSIYLTC